MSTYKKKEIGITPGVDISTWPWISDPFPDNREARRLYVPSDRAQQLLPKAFHAWAEIRVETILLESVVLTLFLSSLDSIRAAESQCIKHSALLLKQSSLEMTTPADHLLLHYELGQLLLQTDTTHLPLLKKPEVSGQ